MRVNHPLIILQRKINMYCSKENIVLYLENRIKYEKELRDCCTEKDLYYEFTIVIETMEQLLKEFKMFQ